MRARSLIPVVLLAALVAVLVYAVVTTVDSWGDWVVLGFIVMTAVGAAIAINNRQYPTHKRTFVRRSDQDRDADRQTSRASRKP